MNGDLWILGGNIIDGTGNEAYSGDLLVRQGRIADLGVNLQPPKEAQILKVHGLCVSPGFIDVHSHSDFTLLIDPRAVSSITQGVTLEIVGNCGHGCAPVGDPELVESNIYGYEAAYGIRWRSMAEYLEELERKRPAVNVITLVPNGNLRLAAAGLVNRPSNADEIRQMSNLLEQSLEEGAFGFSTGLEYGPERDCSEHEITELCRVLARKGGVYATHTRNEYGNVEETIAEAIRAARAAEVPLQISHIGVVARLSEDSREAVEEALAICEKANRSGLDVTFDMHTRHYGITNLSAVLPSWALAGGKSGLIRRLEDPATRAKMKTLPNLIASEAQGRWDKLILFGCRNNPELTGKTIAEVSQEWNLEPLDVVYDVLLSEIDNLHEILVIGLIYDPDDLRLPFQWEDCMVGSDATALANDGPLKNKYFHGAFTWAAWFYRYFVREKEGLSPEEAVHRLTWLPAQRFGLGDRGVIRKGARADLAIFDPGTFGEKGTIFEPNQVADGMVHVLVNGVLTLKNGELTGERGGEVLRNSNRAHLA